MQSLHRPRFIYALMLFLVAVINSQGQPGTTLAIYAATSLTDAFEQLAAEFVLHYPQAEIAINFSSSSTLAAQLLAGAPADVFASANDAQMDLVVAEEGINADAIHIFAGNQLVLILPADNPAEIESMADLANKPVLLVLAVPGTPIRDYTDAMLHSYNDDLGNEFLESVLDNLVSEESNVRQVVARVALGEADAGIVYRSDVVGEVANRLITLEIDELHNQLASYPIAVLADGEQKALAGDFVNFVLSKEGQMILQEYGFCSFFAPLQELESEATPEPSNSAKVEEEVEARPCDGNQT